MIRWQVTFVCIALALGACAATPMNFAAAPQEDFLSDEQRSLREIAREGDELFHQAGWVPEENGRGIQRIAGILLHGADSEEARPDPVELYLQANSLLALSVEERLAYFRSDAERLTGMVQAVNRAGQAVIASDVLNSTTIDGDLQVLDRFIGDARQAVTLFSRLNGLPIDEGGAGGELANQITAAQNSFSGLSAMADAIQARRAEMRVRATG